MKKRLFLTFVMVFVFALMLAFAVSAGTVHNENTVDYSATVTLDDGTKLELFDNEGNALIWYISGTQDGKNLYSSVRADDDEKVKWTAESWDEVQTWSIANVDKNKVVVINLMDDDVIRNTGNEKYLGKPVDKFKFLFSGMKNLEYCYLRLDTKNISRESFKNCSKLKYINLENLTEYSYSAQWEQFANCTSLFAGQVLDLTKTKVYKFENYSTFASVPFKGVKFPETMKEIGSGTTFANCTNLEFISIGNKAILPSNTFDGCTSLKAIYYVGTLDQLNASTIPAAFTDATSISYANYKALSDKSGKYIVYDYSRCIAFNGGIHGETTATNNCVGTCNVCGDTVVKHAEEKNLSVSIAYAKYDADGTKTTTCQNAGCGYCKEEDAAALFICSGYSTPIKDRDGLAIGFIVNNEAIKEYKSVTGKNLTYGVFAVAQEKLGENDVFDSNGTAGEYVVNAEITGYEFASFELRIVGFTADTKDVKLAMGAYVKVTDGDTSTYSYMQGFEPNEGEKYFFVSYSDVSKKAK